MKRKILLTLASGLILAACGNTSNETNSTNEGTATAEENKEETNQEFSSPGDTKELNGVKATFIDETKINDTVSIADNVEMSDISVLTLEYTEINEDYKDMYDFMNVSEGDTVLQLSYTITNNNDFPLSGIDMPVIVTSTNEQLDNTTAQSFGAYEIQPQASANGVGTIQKISDPNINGLRITFNHLYRNDDTYESIEPRTVSIDF